MMHTASPRITTTIRIVLLLAALAAVLIFTPAKKDAGP